MIILAWTLVGFGTFFLACACMVNRGMKKAPLLEDDQVTPELPFPGPIIKQKSIEDRKQWDPDLHMRKLAWAERQEWEEAVYEDIEELTQPGEAY